MTCENNLSELPTLDDKGFSQSPWIMSSYKPLALTCSKCRSSMLSTFNFCNACGAPSTSSSSSSTQQSTTSSAFSVSSPENSISTSPMITPPKYHEAIPQSLSIELLDEYNEYEDDMNGNDFDFSSINDLVDNMSPVSNLRKEELKISNQETVCKFFLKGKCRSGRKCKYKHLDAQSSLNLEKKQTQPISQTILVDEPHTNIKPSLPSPHYQPNQDPAVDVDVLCATSGLGLPCSPDAIQTVGTLLQALRDQCKSFDPVAARKAKATLNRLLHVPTHHEGVPSRNLYVHGFGKATNESDVEALFSLFCEVKCVVMKEVLNRSTGEVDGRYCFVWTDSVQQACTARSALDKFELNGYTLEVNFAKDRRSPLEHDNRNTRKETPVEHSHHTNPPSRNLFVANFPDHFTASDTAALFSNYCEVKRVVMKSAGYCFVWTGGIPQAVQALNCLNGANINGCVLQVAYAKEKEGSANKTKLPCFHTPDTHRCVTGEPVLQNAMFLNSDYTTQHRNHY